MPESVDRRLTAGLFTWIAGMIGTFFLVLSLPRLSRLFARRALPRIASEFIWIALTGLLFDLFTRWLSRDDA